MSKIIGIDPRECPKTSSYLTSFLRFSLSQGQGNGEHGAEGASYHHF